MTVTFPIRVAVLGILGALALASCGTDPVLPCPPVRADSNTARFVQFQKNARDLTEVVYSVELVGYRGHCELKDDRVDMVMDLTFDVTAGPGAQPATIEIPYYVAIPQFHPDPAGKRVMTVTAKVPGKPGLRQQVKETGVRVRIPLEENEPAAAYDVFVGIQMSTADADYNRERRTRDLEAARTGK